MVEYIKMPLNLNPAGSKNKTIRLLGADPEVFLKNRITGKVVTSIGLIGGKKGDGVTISGDFPRMKWLEDNVAVEFNFPPVTGTDSFQLTVETVLNQANKKLLDRDLEIFPTCTNKFSNSDLAFPQAQIFGCDPDFSAYDLENKPRVVDPNKLGNYRFCGGHLHFGFTNKDNIPIFALAILADVFLGLPSLSYDKQGLRRAYYGCAGLYRPKSYGFEYRTLSNFWLRPEHGDILPGIANECFCLLGCFEGMSDRLARLFDKIPLKDLQVIIDNERLKDANILWRDMRQYAANEGMYLGQYFHPRNTE